MLRGFQAKNISVVIPVHQIREELPEVLIVIGGRRTSCWTCRTRWQSSEKARHPPPYDRGNFIALMIA